MGRGKPTLAIVSSNAELCGIAAYMRHLKVYLSESYDVEVLPLDQYVLRQKAKHLVESGDAQIRELCDRLPAFDYVNLQLEHGTLGNRQVDILRRFKMIVEAAPRISITFHSVIRPPEKFKPLAFTGDLAKGKGVKAYNRVRDYKNDRRVSSDIYRYLREKQREKSISLIVHTPRERKYLALNQRLGNVHDHPLAFIPESRTSAILKQATPASFPRLRQLPEGAKTIGVFGFISPYKGFETAVKALQHLPEEYHLLIFGGVNPRELEQGAERNDYLQRIMDAAHIGRSKIQMLREETEYVDADGYRRSAANNMQIGLGEAVEKSPRDLSGRVHFMGAPSDQGFLEGMALCDVVVMPYLEVGQTSSGPISQAVELGKRVLASRNHAFLEFAKYHGDRVELFDVGNEYELANRIVSPAEANLDGSPFYGTATNRIVYEIANSMDPSRDSAAAIRDRVAGSSEDIRHAA